MLSWYVRNSIVIAGDNATFSELPSAILHTSRSATSCGLNASKCDAVIVCLYYNL